MHKIDYMMAIHKKTAISYGKLYSLLTDELEELYYDLQEGKIIYDKFTNFYKQRRMEKKIAEFYRGGVK